MNSEYCKHCNNNRKCHEKPPYVVFSSTECRKHAMKTVYYECGEEVALFPNDYVGKPLQHWKDLRV